MSISLQAAAAGHLQHFQTFAKIPWSSICYMQFYMQSLFSEHGTYFICTC